jgi:hypothetical protein
MGVHDWTRVDAGIFHSFHQAWNAEMHGALNTGLLPPDYYALIEQHAGKQIPDLLTLHVSSGTEPLPTPSGGVAVAALRPKVSRRFLAPPAPLRRTIAIRHVSGHRLVALIEVVSPANKDRAERVLAFATKAADALRARVHVLAVDLFPPGPSDPRGMHGAIWSQFDPEPVEIPEKNPLTVASYLAGWQPEACLEHLAVGDLLPGMALFLTEEICVPLPLDATYQAAYGKTPAFWREVLEARDGE